MPTQARTVTMPPLDVRADVSAVHDETRTVDVTFATAKADVLRYDWMTGKRYFERLSLDPKHVRMGRLESGMAPVLDSHSAYSIAHVMGVVKQAALEGKRAIASLRFSTRAEVEPYYQDIKAKIIQAVSVGYRVFRFEDLAETREGLPIRLAIDWEPYEISMVPMGADVGARTRSSREVDTNECEIIRATNLVAADADRLRLFRYVQTR